MSRLQYLRQCFPDYTRPGVVRATVHHRNLLILVKGDELPKRSKVELGKVTARDQARFEVTGDSF